MLKNSGILEKSALLLSLMLPGLGLSGPEARASEIVGEAEVLLYDDFAGKSVKAEYFLHSFRGAFSGAEKIRLNDTNGLRSSRALEELRTGDTVKVECLEQQVADSCSIISLQVVSRQVQSATGVRTSLWMIVDVNDVENPYDRAYVAGKLEMNRSWYQKASYGQLDFIEDADGDGQKDIVRVSIDYNKSVDGCNASKIASMAVAAASAQGVDTSLFRHRVFILPPLSCGWGGLGHLGCGSSCSSWIASVNWNLVYPHELGHNLGMHHAATDPENDGQVNSEYGDGSCPMGNRLSQGFFNGPHTKQMGWLSESDGHILNNPETGDYSINALSSVPEAGNPSLIHLSHGGKNYYLSYRPSTSFDKVAQTYRDGFSVHTYDGGKTRTRYIGTFGAGDTFKDGDLTIRQNERNADFVSVHISNGEPDEDKVLKEVSLRKRLYPPSLHSSVIRFSGTVTPGHVDLISDWWLKRPTLIRVFREENGQKGELIGEQAFPDYDNMICGENYDSACTYPGAPDSRLSVSTGDVAVSGIIVEISGLLSVANKFAILKKLVVRD